MRLDPGPIPPISTSWYDATVEDPDFVTLVRHTDSALIIEEGAMDSWLDPLLTIDAVLPDDGMTAALDALDQSNGSTANLAGLWQLDPIDAMTDPTSAKIIDIYNTIPAEAFADVPSAGDYGAAGAPFAFLDTTGITISNTSSPNYEDYLEGENFRITVVLSTANVLLEQYYQVEVDMYPAQNLTARPMVNLGQTALDGTLVYNSTWPAGSAGEWQATFYTVTTAGNQIPGPTLHWTVLPADATVRSPLGTVKVVLRNLYNLGSDDVYAVGQQWVLDVWGAPGADVVLGGYKDGQPLSQVTLGTTDSTGHFQTNGTMLLADVGSWIETYMVGGVPWDGQLQFTVSQ